MYIRIVKKDNKIYYILVLVDNKNKDVKASRFITEKIYLALKDNNVKVFER